MCLRKDVCQIFERKEYKRQKMCCDIYDIHWAWSYLRTEAQLRCKCGTRVNHVTQSMKRNKHSMPVK